MSADAPGYDVAAFARRRPLTPAPGGTDAQEAAFEASLVEQAQRPATGGEESVTLLSALQQAAREDARLTIEPAWARELAAEYAALLAERDGLASLLRAVADTQQALGYHDAWQALGYHDACAHRAEFGDDPEFDEYDRLCIRDERERLEEKADDAIGAVLVWAEEPRAALAGGADGR